MKYPELWPVNQPLFSPKNQVPMPAIKTNNEWISTPNMFVHPFKGNCTHESAVSEARQRWMIHLHRCTKKQHSHIPRHDMTRLVISTQKQIHVGKSDNSPFPRFSLSLVKNSMADAIKNFPHIYSEIMKLLGKRKLWILESCMYLPPQKNWMIGRLCDLTLDWSLLVRPLDRLRRLKPTPCMALWHGILLKLDCFWGLYCCFYPWHPKRDLTIHVFLSHSLSKCTYCVC